MSMNRRSVQLPAGPARAPRDGSNLGEVIQAYMRARGVETQADMAGILGVDRSLVSMYVKGRRRCHDVVQLRQFAAAMDLPPETFGLIPRPDDRGEGSGPATEEVNHWRLVRQSVLKGRTASPARAGSQRSRSASMRSASPGLTSSSLCRSTGPKLRPHRTGRSVRLAAATSDTARRSAPSQRRLCSRTAARIDS